MHSSRMRTARYGGLPMDGKGALHTPWNYGKADLPVNRMTDTFENITFPQLRLRTLVTFYRKKNENLKKYENVRNSVELPNHPYFI